MYINGVVMQSLKDNGYKGIDGSGFSPQTAENWYLNNVEGCERFEEYYDEHIGKTYYNVGVRSYVAACNDWNYIDDYIQESNKRKIPFRIIMCETEISEPVMVIPSDMKMVFLGYDYAYATGDNYSAVYNEIPFVFSDFHMNHNGLFETEKEIREYIGQREIYEKTHPQYTLEAGDFIIFKLYEVMLDA